MRYERMTQLFDLALELVASRRGLTMAEVQALLGVSRRTAERQLQALDQAFGMVEDVDGGSRRKRWRLQAPALRQLVRVSAEELAELTLAAESLDRAGLSERAATVRALATKLRAVQRGDGSSQAADGVDAELEALMRTEGTALGAGPRQQLAPGLLALLRRCIRHQRVVAFDYLAQASGRRRRRRVQPYGVLTGNRTFLVAREARLAGKSGDGLRLWRLGNVENAAATDETFERDAEFDLARYARQSFGTFQERPANVVLRFRGSAVRDAKGFVFHPEQTAQPHEDGTLTVRFRAGGLDEMCWHLVTWGDLVVVEQPLRLRRRLAEMCAALAAHHGTAKSTAVGRG